MSSEPLVPNRDRNAEGRPENARPRDRFGAPLPRGSVDEMAHKEEPEEVVGSVAEAFERAVSLFDEQRFFEAHEFLEYIWKSDEVAREDRDFWKGITQVAVGSCHVQRGNETGAVTLLQRAADHLAPYPPEHHGVSTTQLAARARELIATVQREGVGPDRPFFAFPRAQADQR